MKQDSQEKAVNRNRYKRNDVIGRKGPQNCDYILYSGFKENMNLMREMKYIK